MVGLTERAAAVEAETGDRGESQLPSVAQELVRQLDCAVVAMRYPVTDEFAITFADSFYERLLGREQLVDVAVARALAQTAGVSGGRAAPPAVSLATPGLFGTRAAGLTLTVPSGQPRMDPAGRRMAYFPEEPERFVGRAEVMAKASAALAPLSGRTAVLLHGMAGAGKTACALELAHRHQDTFGVVAFWRGPARDHEFAVAFSALAASLEDQLGDYGFSMVRHIETMADLERFLPRLRQVMADSGMLLVLDNLETLLAADGTWRDPRWGQLIAALTGHDGESRVILTSRVAPSGLVGTQVAGRRSRVVSLPVHPLSLEEAVTLMRELPNFRYLLHADAGLVRAPASAGTDRERVRRRPRKRDSCASARYR